MTMKWNNLKNNFMNSKTDIDRIPYNTTLTIVLV